MKEDKDKKVIIVGNSPSILLNEFGSIVDSYDIVIRINHCPTDGFEKFIGKKINIWSTTKNEIHNNFFPDEFPNLSYIWHRTPTTKRRLIIPDKPKIPSHVMYKTPNFRNKFGHLIAKDKGWLLKGTDHEFCTGLLTILTSTIFYNDVTVVGFTFYTEQKDNKVSGYYRESQLKDDNTHDEDIYWQKNKEMGFASMEIGKIKQKILTDLINEGSIKMLNEKELGQIKI